MRGYHGMEHDRYTNSLKVFLVKNFFNILFIFSNMFELTHSVECPVLESH